MLDILGIMLKKANQESNEFETLMDVMPLLLEIVQKSDDVYLLLHGASCLRIYASVAHKQILER